MKYLKDIISITEPPAEMAKKITDAGIKIHLMDDLIAAGAETPAPAALAKTDDTAVLMYTSGTTGNPKGVLISHKAILCVMAAGLSKNSALSVNGKSVFDKDSTYLAYLPLAHIMELAVELTAFACGCQVGYGNPGTLASTSIKMLQTKPPQLGDAQVLRPTVFVAAPAVLDKLLIAKLIFKKVQGLLGGRCSLMVTGSAPLAGDVQKYVQTVFACPVRQGYGLTETCAATCIAMMFDNTTAQVGPPQESACIRLRDWEEGGYRNSDKDDPDVGKRRGEILIGGPSICQGYLVDKDDPDPDVVSKNENDFVTIDGIRYFCTGDIGQFTKTGNLMIIDRKKDLVKLQMGEYVALSKVESALKTSPYVALPMVHASSSMSYCIALICPNVPELKKLGVEGDLSALCKNETVIAAVLKDVQAAFKAAKLQKFEIPTKVVLIDDLWTPENDMLTAVMKLKRKDILSKHKAQVDSIYV